MPILSALRSHQRLTKARVQFENLNDKGAIHHRPTCPIRECGRSSRVPKHIAHAAGVEDMTVQLMLAGGTGLRKLLAGTVLAPAAAA